MLRGGSYRCGPQTTHLRGVASGDNISLAFHMLTRLSTPSSMTGATAGQAWVTGQRLGFNCMTCLEPVASALQARLDHQGPTCPLFTRLHSTGTLSSYSGWQPHHRDTHPLPPLPVLPPCPPTHGRVSVQVIKLPCPPPLHRTQGEWESLVRTPHRGEGRGRMGGQMFSR